MEETEAQTQDREDKVPTESPLVPKDFPKLDKTKRHNYDWKEVPNIQDSGHAQESPVKAMG